MLEDAKPCLKGLLVRTQGTFYTPPLIGQHLARVLAHVYSQSEKTPLRIIDPFCGDGRLVCWFLEALRSVAFSDSNSLCIHLWDLDASALAIAKEKVKATSTAQAFKVDLKDSHCDTFLQGPKNYGKYDIVITNPPWDVLKPDRRELKELDQASIAKYTEHLREQQNLLEELFPLSKPTRRFSRWGVNLSRCGTELSLRLLTPNGVLGIVAPASLLADQVSERLREWILKKYQIQNIAYFPAEARLFNRVDQAAVTIVASKYRESAPRSFSPTLSTYDRGGVLRIQEKFHIKQDLLQKINYVIPAHIGPRAISILNKFQDFHSFSELEGEIHSLYAGRELDETRHRLFLTNKGKFLFLKGRMVGRFKIVEVPKQYIISDGPRIPDSVNFPRVVWRDVSRPTQKRRMQATIIPAGWVTGNSLNIAFFRLVTDEKLKALLAIMNSFVFEFQLRVFLATAHVSLGTVRKVKVPWPIPKKTLGILADLTDRCMSGDKKALVEFEVLVAQLYELTKDEYELVLKCFAKLDKSEYNQLVQCYK